VVDLTVKKRLVLKIIAITKEVPAAIMLTSAVAAETALAITAETASAVAAETPSAVTLTATRTAATAGPS
jgi:hypothetical protein